MLHPQCRQILLVFVLLIVPNTGSPEQNLKQRIEDGIQTGHQFSQIKLSSSETNWIKRHPKVIVAGTSGWVPIDFVDKKGRYSGIASDYLKLIEKKTGLNFQIIIDEWSHNLEKIRTQEVDVLSAVLYTEAREGFLSYSSAYFEALDYFFIRDDLSVETLEDLNGKRVAIAKDFAHVELLKKYFPKIEIVHVKSFDDSIDAVLENRADMLYDSYAALTHRLKKQGISTIVPFKSTREYGANPIHFVTRKDQPELAAIIQKGLDAISYQEKQAIYNRWIKSDFETNNQSLQLTAEEKNWLAKHPNIRLGSESNWLPIEFIDHSGRMQGFSADVIKILEQRLGIRFNLYPQINWSETFNRLNNHELDIVASIVKTKRREKHLSFSQAYLTPSIVIYTRKDSPGIGGLDALNGKTVSVENNYYILERLKKGYPDINLHLVDTTSQALIALSHGEVDAYIGIQGPANAIIEQNALTNLKIAQDAGLGKAHLRFAVRND